MSETNWQEWDRTLAALYSIESNAGWIAQHASKIEHAVKLLPHHPCREAGAAERLKLVLERLDLTTALCRSALEAVDSKPVLMQAAE